MHEMNKAKTDDVNMLPVGFRITRILTDYICPITSRALVETFLCMQGVYIRILGIRRYDKEFKWHKCGITFLSNLDCVGLK